MWKTVHTVISDKEPFHWSSSSHIDSSFKLICLAEDEKCWCKVLHSQPMCINIVCRLRFSWGELSFSSHSVPFEPTKFTIFSPYSIEKKCTFISLQIYILAMVGDHLSIEAMAHIIWVRSLKCLRLITHRHTLMAHYLLTHNSRVMNLECFFPECRNGNDWWPGGKLTQIAKQVKCPMVLC